MYEEKDFSHLMGLAGFSDTMLGNHLKLYAGYVKNTNALLEKLQAYEVGSPEYNELTRRFGWEFNGMRLHELYFENMSKTPGAFQADSALAEAMGRSFGEPAKCGENFKSLLKMRGIGWAVTYYDPGADRMFNVWIDEHGTNHPSGAVPLVVMDLWEHAFMTDYGLDKMAYWEAFHKALDWSVVEGRFEVVQKVMDAYSQK